ncbi:MAG: hypothetical protein AVDCRST_MAG19-1099 [uncultured Thermomicrobiales bacterium]|uniref:Uncharacterized protein n=1 Tax=uncultured Thermomicrobiales bacterium TaxID=1645740 RepID=A0A6J4ULY6_9BACT|nr:MAG: hypothetical protein AVDCRST_MAG19-1099 [uncultured Thermomicrobiales bacterium]
MRIGHGRRRACPTLGRRPARPARPARSARRGPMARSTTQVGVRDRARRELAGWELLPAEVA